MQLKLLEQLKVGLVGILLAGVSLGFVRGIGDAFDLTKATILWIGSLLLISVWVAGRPRIQIDVVNLAGSFLALGLIVASAASERPVMSIFGQYQRNTGLLTLFACLIIFVVIASERGESAALKKIVFAMQLVALLAASYSLVQQVGIDPWDWVTPGQDRAVFGTLGNSNTTSGFVACAISLFLGSVQLGRSSLGRVAATTGVVFLASAVGVLGAFQGVVAGSVGALFVGVVAVLRAGPLNSIVATLAACTFVMVSLFLSDSGSSTVVMCLIASLLVGAIVRWIPSTEISIMEWLRSSSARVWSAICSAVVAIGVVIVILGGSISQQVTEGMRERRYFFSAAFDIFKAHPFVGTGLETFGMNFTAVRSGTHGLLYENNRSSSAHSIPLGMFANGGLILGVSYVVFIGTIFVLIIRNRRRVIAEPMAMMVSVAWVATQVQSLVSVEHVALFTQQFVLAGLVVATLRSQSGVSQRRSRFRSRSGARASLPILGVGVVATVLLAFPLTRPIRADSAGLWSLRYAALGDPARSLEYAQRAVDLAPWSSQQRIRWAQALYDARDPRYATGALEVSKQLDYTPPYAIEAAYRISESGDFALGLDVAEKAMSRDPKSRSLRLAVADLYLQVGQIQADSGDIESAKASLQRAIDLDGNATVSATARSALDALGS
jgi:O-antigen ligase